MMVRTSDIAHDHLSKKVHCLGIRQHDSIVSNYDGGLPENGKSACILGKQWINNVF